MAEPEVDVAIIGAGTAGLASYRRARDHTDRLVLIEGGRTPPPAPGPAACRASC
jgi:flavin-dependent dehydrogenase